MKKFPLIRAREINSFDKTIADNIDLTVNHLNNISVSSVPLLEQITIT